MPKKMILKAPLICHESFKTGTSWPFLETLIHVPRGRNSFGQRQNRPPERLRVFRNQPEVVILGADRKNRGLRRRECKSLWKGKRWTANWGHCKLDLTMKVNQVNCWFLRRGETGVPGEKLSVQSREPTNSTHI